MNQRIQASQVQVTQQRELVKQLQAKLSLTEGQVMELKVFQTLSLEAHTKIEVEQQQLISKIEIIQHYFQEVRKYFDNIILLEKEAKVARNTFQKEVACSGSKEMPKDLKLSIAEQIREDIMLKAWEKSIVENKKTVNEVKDDCEGIFDSLDKQALEFERNDCYSLLG